MFKFDQFVNASSIWPTAKDFTDEGIKSGLVRGYNIEIKNAEGKVDWLSCAYIEGDPNVYFNDDFHTWMYSDHGWTPTGRICFRGYGIENYDYEERDTFITPCDANGNVLEVA